MSHRFPNTPFLTLFTVVGFRSTKILFLGKGVSQMLHYSAEDMKCYARQTHVLSLLVAGEQDFCLLYSQ